MKVEKIEIVNFKGIAELSVSPHGRNVYAIGGNGKGKTTFIDAVFKTLTGKGLPAMPTKAGEKRGSINVDLGSINVGAAFNAKAEKMEVTVSSPEGDKYGSPRTMLNELVGIIDFDVAEFMALSPAKKVEQLKKILGIDTTDLDKDYAKVFAERTESNRELKYLQAHTKPYNPLATELIDVTQLEARRMALVTTNLGRTNQVKREAELARDIAEGTERLELLRKEVAQLDAKLTQMANEHMDIEAWLDDNPAASDEAIVAEINAAREHNVAVANTTRELAHREDVKREEKKNEGLNNRLADIEEQKRERIAAVAMPVPGLTFTEDGLFLDGLPFESNQINTARQIIAGLQLCGALHKSVQIARFDGTLLDNVSLKEVEDWAATQGIQLFIELVARDGTEGLQIQISE
jgi:DNA repair exonuclease SbcCD ATPase subunit